MKHFYRTRDRPGNYTNQLILKERREKLKQVKRIIAVLLALTVIMLAACSDFGTAVKAAEIGGGNDVNLDCYGEYISNDELGELISYGGYISKSEYARHINDDSVGASYTPSFEGCYDTGGNQIYVRRAMARQYVGEAALMIFVNSSRAYCIQPGEALNAYRVSRVISSRQSIRRSVSAERETFPILKETPPSIPTSAILRHSSLSGKS